MVKTPSKTLANKILHGLQDLGYKSTTYILKNITDDTAPRQQVLKVCHLLKAAGKLKSFGTGKISWAVTVSSWDESNPFSGLPEDNSQISYSKPFAAKFPGWCSVCDKEIVAGQQICIKRDQHDKKTSLHAECVDKPQQVEVKVPADSVELSDAVKGFDALTKRLGDLVKEVESLKANQPPRVIEIVKPDKSTTKLEERVHPIFEQVLFHVQCGDNVELVGPTGCGKSVLAEQVARALELPFGFVSMSDGVTESRLFGRVTPNLQDGKMHYTRPLFVELFEEGGLFLIDERDAGDPNVLLSINAALSVGQLALDRPGNPIANRDKDFVCMSAANTWDNGADRMYVGRNQQDNAFTQRFTQIAMDYDRELERSLCPEAPQLVDRMHRYRDNMYSNKIQRVISTRFIVKAYNWMKHGKGLDYVDTMLFSGWREDEVNKVRG